MKQVTLSVPANMLFSVLFLLNLASISQCCPSMLLHPSPQEIHQVSVKYYDRHLCTGSLINPSYVMTVGTCFFVSGDYSSKLQDIRVVLLHPTLPIILFNVSIKNVIMHENLHIQNSSFSFVNDIALVILSSPQSPTPKVPFGYAKIPLRYEFANPYLDNVAIASGFISPDPEFDPSVVYRIASVYVTPQQNCTEDVALAPSRICVDDRCRKPPECKYNLGGALIVDGQVIGLLSRRQVNYCGFGYEKDPAAFTYVSWYSDWILTQIFKETALENNRCSIGCLPYHNL